MISLLVANNAVRLRGCLFILYLWSVDTITIGYSQLPHHSWHRDSYRPVHGWQAYIGLTLRSPFPKTCHMRYEYLNGQDKRYSTKECIVKLSLAPDGLNHM